MKVLLVSGSRADRGLLHPVYEGLKEKNRAVFIEINRSYYNDTPLGVTEKFNEAMFNVTSELTETEYNLVVVLGDRFEILAAVIASTLCRVPIAHISGGDVTVGSYDNQFRNAITKLSHIHFTAHEQAARNVYSMGETNVYVVGVPGVPECRDKEAVVPSGIKKMMVMHYPATIVEEKEFDEVLAAVDSMKGWVESFILPNPDVGSGYAGKKLANRARVYTGLPRQEFMNMLFHCDVLVGNSSAGLYEAPNLRTPTVNVGIRQMGRVSGPSVIHCPAERNAIVAAVEKALQVKDFTNPYYCGDATEKIVEALGMHEEEILSKEILKKGWG